MKKIETNNSIIYRMDWGDYHAQKMISNKQLHELKVVLQDRVDDYIEEQLAVELYELKYGYRIK